MLKLILVTVTVLVSHTLGLEEPEKHLEDRVVENAEDEYNDRFGIYFPLPNIAPTVDACSTTTIGVTARCNCGTSTCNVGQTCGGTNYPNTCLNPCGTPTPNVPPMNFVCACPTGVCTSCAGTACAGAGIPICRVSAGVGTCIAQ